MGQDHPHEHSHSDHGHDHDHDHDHGGGLGALFHAHSHSHAGQAPRALSGALVMTILFMLIEAAGGWFANSLALLSDAGHMLTDVGALLLSLFALWIARRPRTETMTFGYHRAEILGALLSGLMIWLIAGLLVYEAVMRLHAPEEVKGSVVFVVATIGLLANLASMRMLHSQKEHNINVRAAYLHMVADSLGSVGAIIAGAVLWLTDWRPIDPLITIIFAVLMLASSWGLVKEAVGVLMESAPSHLDMGAVREALAGVSGVQELHDLHLWSVSSGRTALSVHLITPGKPEDVLASANQVLEERFGIKHTTIQVEHPDRFTSSRCYDCGPGEEDERPA